MSSDESSEASIPSEEDDEDLSSDDAPVVQKKRKGKRPAARVANKKKRMESLFDEEAVVDDDDEEDYDDEQRVAATELNALEKEAHDRVRRRQELGSEWDERTVEERAKQLESKYKKQGRNAARAEAAAGEQRRRDGFSDDDDEVMPGAIQEVAQQSLLPSIQDPKLFAVGCSAGKEQLLVLSLMNKAVAFAKSNRSIGIRSAMCTGSKGFIYVEAMNEPEVRTAINGLQMVYHSKLKMVPIPDMTSVLHVRTTKRPISEGQYVRLTRGHYRGDLAYVERLLNFGEKAVLKFVPRLDLSQINRSAEEKNTRKGMKPPQKWFDPVEVGKAGGVIERRRFINTGDMLDWFSGNFYRNGFVLKEVNVSSQVNSVDVEPTLEELQQFRSRKDSEKELHDSDSDGEHQSAEKEKLDVMAELAAIKERAGTAKPVEKMLFAKDDTVVVSEGDLTGLMAKVVNIKGTGSQAIISVRPLSKEIADEIVELEPYQLNKYVRYGSHVKVLEGRHAGETGTVMSVQEAEGGQGQEAVVLTDLSAKEIQVLVPYLQETMDIVQGLDSLQGYELYDLVSLGPNEVAVVTRVGREELEVLNHSGNARTIRPEEITGKRNAHSSKSISLDAEHNQLHCDDAANVVDGRFRSRSGTIKRMHRATLWLHSRTHNQHGGIFVVRARSVVLAGNRTRFLPPAAVGYMGTASSGKDTMIRDYKQRDDHLMGKTVKLVKGQYKGHLGVVVEVTESHVNVEMATKRKTITVSRAQVKPVGDKDGAFNRQGISASSGASMVPRTPALAAETPRHSGVPQTPTHAPATPAHDDVWRPTGADTPAHTWGSSGGDGGGASAYGEWGEEPAGDGAATPARSEGGWGAAGGTTGYSEAGSTDRYSAPGTPGEMHQPFQSTRAFGDTVTPATSSYSPYTSDLDRISSPGPGSGPGGKPLVRKGAWVKVRVSRNQGYVTKLLDATRAELVMWDDNRTATVHLADVEACKPDLVGHEVEVVTGNHGGRRGKIKQVTGQGKGEAEIEVVVKLKGRERSENAYFLLSQLRRTSRR
ncbi:unnamed protein product [Chrysoparadoxa australica]